MSEFLVGTAGHVDHGKTALLRALTGIDCDRLPEERRRGITIDLGFAHLERRDVVLGFVDVPGHERFVHNALAGLGGIRLLLLVVAADEGVRAQTREHLAIAELLEIPELVVALTKVDLVDDEAAGLATLELEELLAPTRWAGARVLRTSSLTGEGVEALADELLARARAAAALPAATVPARLPVDRAFTPRGQGVVVTGTLFQGRVATGDELRLLPGEATVRVRALQAHGTTRAEITAGGRAALQLAGIDLAAIARGQELVASGGPAATRRLLVRVRLLADSPLELGGSREVRLHVAAAERPARVRALHPARIAPGGEGLVVVRVREPLVAARGDRVVLRRLSPAATLGGGTVLDPRWRRPRGLDLVAHLEALAGDEAGALVAWAEAAGAAGVGVEECAMRLGHGDAAARAALAALVADGRLLSGAQRFFHPRALAALERRARDLLAERFAGDRLADSMPKAELVRRLLARRAAPLADFHLGWLGERGAVAVAGDRIAAPGRQAELSSGEKGLAAAILDEYERCGLEPPSPQEVARRLAAKPEIVAGLVRHLVNRSRLVRLPGGLLFAGQALERLATELAATGWESFSVAQFKDRFGLSRKWAIPLLEHLDAIRVTRRAGDRRLLVVRGRAAEPPPPRG